MEPKGTCNQGHLKKGINRAEEGNLHLLNDDYDKAIFMFLFFSILILPTAICGSSESAW